MSIQNWLREFRSGWMAKDTKRVLLLFEDNVEYWETPFTRIKNKIELAREWEYIKTQNNIEIRTRVLLSCRNKHVINWELKYVDDSGHKQSWAGTYIISLNNHGLCTYFFQTGEKE